MVAPLVFVVVFSVAGCLRSDYSARSMFVSELALGPHGWVQIVNFLVSGALITVFGRGLAAHSREGGASRGGPLLVQVIGVSLAMSGPFVTDPSAMFNQSSPHGLVHGILGALVFSLAPVTCFVFYRRFRSDPAWRSLASWTLAAAVILTSGIPVLKVSQLPTGPLFDWKGVVQRVLLVTLMTWLFTLAVRLRRTALSST